MARSYPVPPCVPPFVEGASASAVLRTPRFSWYYSVWEERGLTDGGKTREIVRDLRCVDEAAPAPVLTVTQREKGAETMIKFNIHTCLAWDPTSGLPIIVEAYVAKFGPPTTEQLRVARLVMTADRTTLVCTHDVEISEVKNKWRLRDIVLFASTNVVTEASSHEASLFLDRLLVVGVDTSVAARPTRDTGWALSVADLSVRWQRVLTWMVDDGAATDKTRYTVLDFHGFSLPREFLVLGGTRETTNLEFFVATLPEICRSDDFPQLEERAELEIPCAIVKTHERGSLAHFHGDASRELLLGVPSEKDKWILSTGRLLKREERRLGSGSSNNGGPVEHAAAWAIVPVPGSVTLGNGVAAQPSALMAQGAILMYIPEVPLADAVAPEEADAMLEATVPLDPHAGWRRAVLLRADIPWSRMLHHRLTPLEFRAQGRTILGLTMAINAPAPLLATTWLILPPELVEMVIAALWGEVCAEYVSR